MDHFEFLSLLVPEEMVKEDFFVDVEFGVLETVISAIIEALGDDFGHWEDEALT